MFIKGPYAHKREAGVQEKEVTNKAEVRMTLKNLGNFQMLVKARKWAPLEPTAEHHLTLPL